MANGSRADSSGVFIDGINDESPRDEVRRIANQPAASFHFRSSRWRPRDTLSRFAGLFGSVVNMVTKSGGNRFDGSLFEFVRNDLFDASPSQLHQRQRPKDEASQKPVWGRSFRPGDDTACGYSGRDRTFFLLSLESLRSVTGTSATALWPTILTGRRIPVSAWRPDTSLHNPRR